MAKQLKLEVLLNAIDKITGPVKAATKSSDAMAKAVKANRDQLKALQNAQKDIKSFRTLNKASKASKDALSQQQEKIKDLAAQMRQSDTPTKGMIRSFNAATKAAKRLKDKHEKNTQKLSGLRTKLKDAGISTRDLGQAERNLKSDIDKTSKSLKRQQDQLKETNFQQRKLAAAKRKYESSQRLAGNMATGGAAGLGVAYGVKNIAERTIAPGIDFGTQMSELQAVSRLSKEDPRFKMLKDQAKQFGASTAFTSSEVGAGQTFLSRAGFTPEAISASMKDVLELALANGTDLATTADIASNIGGAFKIDPEVEGNMQHIADILSGVSSRANVDLTMLGDTMKYLGQASGLDVSMEEAAAMAGLLGNIGIQGSMAGTTMRTMLNQLTAPAAKGAAAMKELGLQVKDSHGNMRSMPNIIADIAAATESMGNVDRAAILKDIFGAEAGSGVAELIAQQGTGGLQTLISELKGVQGENAKMAATRADNIGGDLKSLESSLQSISLAITETNEGPLRELIKTMTSASRSVSEWATKNPELVATLAKIAVVVGIVAGAGGALLLVISSILGPLAMLKYGFAVFSSVASGLIPIVKGIGLAMSVVGKAMLANPIFLAIALIAGAAYLIYNHWEPIKEFFSGIWETIKTAFDGGILGISELILNWSPLGLFYKAFAGVLNYFGMDLPAKFTDFGSMMLDGLMGGITTKLSALKESIVGVGSSVAGWFKEKLGIHSPSRVFAEFGVNTLQGFENGIDKEEGTALNKMGKFAKNTAALGAGIVATSGAMAFDTQPAISPTAYSLAMPGMSNNSGGGDTYNFYVTGSDSKDIAAEIEAILRQRDAEKERQQRSTLSDRYNF